MYLSSNLHCLFHLQKSQEIQLVNNLDTKLHVYNLTKEKCHSISLL